ncbi:MAG: HET-C-related protein [Nostoc sp.]|uniref:HET-C-related protein n=1 Tax=Nostoc sp. TaxID=1180 RepID=UPI002FF6E57C
MSDRTLQLNKSAASSFTNPSLASLSIAKLANPIRGFGSEVNTAPSQIATKLTSDLQEAQSADEQLSEPEALKEKPLSHDISRISLRRPQAKLDKYEPAKNALTPLVQQMGDALANRKVIQRYQAGESGHASIEKKGLILAGFTADEAADAYLGNWMRDLSQLGPDMFPLVELLGMGEFGKPIDQSKLGTYVPSEHMDNPDGGNTVEDPTSATSTKDIDARNENKKQLSDSQKKDQEAADAAYADIKAASAKNHLPAYIERGKFMAKRKLVEAIKKGDTPEGREEMSSALHAVEDYFSHTNFTEAAIWVLAKENPAKYKPLMAKMSETTLGTGTATVGGLDKKGLPQIVSGTYVPDANNMVSQIELLKTELESGALTVALVKGLMMKAGITADVLANKLGEKMGIKPILRTVEGGIGAVVGGVEGAVKGTASGARTGGAAGRRIGGLFGSLGEVVGEEIGEQVGGVVGGVSGGVSGARTGEAAGEEMGEQDAEAIIKAAGFTIKGGMVVITASTVATLLIIFPEIANRLTTVVAIAKSKLGQKLLDAYAEKKIAESAKEAKAKGLTGPTHSELAKDAPDHPLFDASASLAVEAVRGIGIGMKAAWAQNKANLPSAEPVGTEGVTSQVDKYVCALDGDGWWRPIIEKQAMAAGITTADSAQK